VTLDKDFGEIAIVRVFAHCGIIRLVNFSVLRQALMCQRVLALHGESLEAGAIVTVEPGRLRIRMPESRNDKGSSEEAEQDE
jgi:predicted nuclease of predicted toxin-antitoxin system